MQIHAQIRDDIELRPSEWAAHLRKLAARRIEPLLVRHGQSSARLRATLEKADGGADRYRVRLQLHLPGRRIAIAEAIAENIPAASTQAMQLLFRESRKHFARLRHEDAWKRKSRRERLDELKKAIAALPPATIEEAEGRLAGMRARLRELAAHELGWLRALGDLPEQWPSVDDVVDEAISNTKAVWKPGTDRDKVWRQLVKNLYRVIDREVALAREAAQMVSLDEALPPDAQEQAEAMVQEEFYEFWQPDDETVLADVLPEDTEPGDDESIAPPLDLSTPAPVLLSDVIAVLPRPWRRALLLSQSEGFEADQIAEVLEAEPDHVRKWLVQAEQFISARFSDAGLTMEMVQGKRWLEIAGAP